ncbi:MAG: hypothetical protein FWC83_02590 [Alphaproteobacteria bacterium]|nr:hypothetical protein [Alphaproteobacteria bacterium]
MDIKTILENRARARFAKDRGTEIHRKLSRIRIDGNDITGDGELVAQIRENEQIAGLFDKFSKPEVPIAGYINDKFTSRRIDRLRITEKDIQFIDYKTDTDKVVRRDAYIRQMNEYATLLQAAYPAHTITGYILWLSDWELEEIK